MFHGHPQANLKVVIDEKEHLQFQLEKMRAEKEELQANLEEMTVMKEYLEKFHNTRQLQLGRRLLRKGCRRF